MSEDESYSEREHEAAGQRRARLSGMPHRQQAKGASTVRRLGLLCCCRPKAHARQPACGLTKQHVRVLPLTAAQQATRRPGPLPCSPAWPKSCGRGSPSTRIRAAWAGQGQAAQATPMHAPRQAHPCCPRCKSEPGCGPAQTVLSFTGGVTVCSALPLAVARCVGQRGENRRGGNGEVCSSRKNGSTPAGTGQCVKEWGAAGCEGRLRSAGRLRMIGACGLCRCVSQ